MKQTGDLSGVREEPRQRVTRRRFLQASAAGVATGATFGALSQPSVMVRAAARQEQSGRALQGTLRIFDFDFFKNTPGQHVIKAYEQMRPGVRIQIEPVPKGDVMIWEKTEMAGGNTAPDLMVPAIYQQEWVDIPKGWWLDVTPYIMRPNPYVRGNKRWYDLIDPQMIESLRFVDGKFYGFPVASNEQAIWYNKDIFRKVGVSVPTTWAQFMAIQQKIKQAGYTPFEYALGDTVSGDPAPTMLSIPEDMVMSGTIHKLDLNHDGKLDVRELVRGIKLRIFSPHNPDYQEFFRLMKDWSAYWELGAAGVSDGNTESSAFVQGRAAMVYTQPSGYTESLLKQAHIDYGFFTFPQITPASSRFATPDVKGTGVGGSWEGYVFGLTNAAKARGTINLAVDFVYWFTASQNLPAINLAQGQPPTAKASLATLDPIGKYFWNVMHHPNRLSFAELALGPSFEADRMSALQGYITGQMSLSAAMDQMQQTYDQAADALINLFHWRF